MYVLLNCEINSFSNLFSLCIAPTYLIKYSRFVLHVFCLTRRFNGKRANIVLLLRHGVFLFLIKWRSYLWLLCTIIWFSIFLLIFVIIYIKLSCKVATILFLCIIWKTVILKQIRIFYSTKKKSLHLLCFCIILWIFTFSRLFMQSFDSFI